MMTTFLDAFPFALLILAFGLIHRLVTLIERLDARVERLEGGGDGD